MRKAAGVSSVIWPTSRRFLPEVRKSLIEQSSGNPLFLVEIVRALGARVAELEASGQGARTSPSTCASGCRPRSRGCSNRALTCWISGANWSSNAARCLANASSTFDRALRTGAQRPPGPPVLAQGTRVPGRRGIAARTRILFRHHLIRETAYQTLLERSGPNSTASWPSGSKPVTPADSTRSTPSWPPLRPGGEPRPGRPLPAPGGQPRRRAGRSDRCRAVLRRPRWRNCFRPRPPKAPRNPRRRPDARRLDPAGARTRQRLQGHAADALDSFARARALPAVEKRRLFSYEDSPSSAPFTHILVTTRDYAAARQGVGSSRCPRPRSTATRACWRRPGRRAQLRLGARPLAPAREAFDRTLALANRAGKRRHPRRRAERPGPAGMEGRPAGGALERFHDSLRVRHQLGDRFLIAQTP